MEENVTTEQLQTAELTKAEKKRLEKERKAKEKSKNKTRKAIVTTTFFITVLCLIAGLLVPLFNCVEGTQIQERMLLRYIPAMFNNVCNVIAKKTLLPEPTGWFLHYDCNNLVEFFISLVGVLYVVACAFAVLMCIPVFLGSKKRNTSANCALASEVLTIIVTALYIGFKTYGLVQSGELSWTDFNFFIPSGGALLMAIIQSVASKGSIGVSKTIAVLLSALGVMAILDITLFIPALSSPLIKLSGMIKSGDKLGFIIGLGEDLKLSGLGVDGINILLSIKNVYAEIFSPNNNWMVIVVYVMLILVSVLTVLNLIVDIFGLGTGKKYNNKRKPCANKGSNTFALVRYILTFLFAGAIIALTFFIDGITTGIYLYLLEAVLFIEIINAAARTAVDNARVKKGQPAPATEQQQQLVIEDPAFAVTNDPVFGDAPVYTEPVAEYAEQPVYSNDYNAEAAQPVYDQSYDQPYEQPYEQPVYEQTSYEQPAYEQPAYEEPVYEQPLSDEYLNEYNSAYNPPVAEPLTAPLEEPAEPTPTVYIYGGATDDFMNTLTDTEKVEFVEVFIKRSKGVVKGVPDYVIDADNTDFFPAVFVHINRYRNIVSDALMSKMYKQLGKL